MGPCWRRPRPIEIGTNANTGVIQYTEEEENPIHIQLDIPTTLYVISWNNLLRGKIIIYYEGWNYMLREIYMWKLEGVSHFGQIYFNVPLLLSWSRLVTLSYTNSYTRFN